MPELRDDDRDRRVIAIDAVLELLQQVKADTAKMIVSLQKEAATRNSDGVRFRRRAFTITPAPIENPNLWMSDNSTRIVTSFDQ